MKRGFTLIELLAVISILSIISLISIPVINSVLEDAQKKTTLESARELIKFASTKVVDDGLLVPYQYKIEDNTLNYTGGDFTKGLVVITNGNDSFVENLSTPKFCINGPLNNLKIEKGSCLNTEYNQYVSGEEILKKYKESSSVVFDDIMGDFYLRGNVNNNYVSYSGRMWRILSFKDGMIKLISQSSIGGSKNYQNTLDYLENSFYNDLEKNNYIEKVKYGTGNITTVNDAVNAVSSSETQHKEFKVSLLSVGEYLRANYNGANFISNGSTWLINKQSTSLGYYLSTNSINTLNLNSSMSYRPVITIKDFVALSGSGTTSDPYKIR